MPVNRETVLTNALKALLARFEQLAPDYEGGIDPSDKRLIKRIEKLLTKGITHAS